MTHDLINYLNEKLELHVSNLGRHLAYLGTDVQKTGLAVKYGVDSLSTNIEKFTAATDKQSNRIYWLTWALVIAGFLNVAAIIFQTYHH